MHEVMLIDGNRSELTSFMEVIKHIKGGAKCTYASSGKQALDLLHHMLPGYIFMHFNEEALKTLSAVRFERRLRTIKIFLYSDTISEEMSKMAKMLGAAGCIEMDPELNGLIHKFRAIFSPDLLPAYVLLKYNCPAVIFGERSPNLADLETEAGLEQQ